MQISIFLQHRVNEFRMPTSYVCLNGNFLPDDQPVISHRNRAFCYGDALFETIHCLGTQPQFIENHWLRLTQGMKILRMDPAGDFSLQLIERYIGKLLNKNRIFKGARIRLTVYRDEGGLYSPENNSISWFMESSALEHEKFELNHKGLYIDIYDVMHKPVNILSNLKTMNGLIFVLAGVFRNENNLDECLILNQYGRITESISSNVFLVKDERIYTPSLSEGCISGTMRYTIIELAGKAGYEIQERGILERNLLDADEIFLTNAIRGIRWIAAYKDRRYYNFVARKLNVKLNEIAFTN
jgi:branched-chain amino acid aminotransferase